MKEMIREYIEKEFLYGKARVEDDERLFEKGIIDSLGFLKLLAFIERDLKVSIDMSEISMERFSTLTEIVLLIEQKQRTEASGR